ncbi:hypothetical protein EJ06DRAFT_553687 [Trichodelitschia bisporula]|uniref:ATP synthase subunit K, mitochondrial n=1 Tax=Trichodelitschia bisporula TaxID=703511 RepID=A0A6G1I4Z1_9PEZI|nr:hypothetical protein EJ06DRAFT_553687 [Trichodelitschia bisporula]
MVAYYKIFGQQVGSHILAIATLSSVFAVSAISMRSPASAKSQGPPIQASSKDEESFIKEFVTKAEADKKH